MGAGPGSSFIAPTLQGVLHCSTLWWSKVEQVAQSSAPPPPP
jgi:hypothetical protein